MRSRLATAAVLMAVILYGPVANAQVLPPPPAIPTPPEELLPLLELLAPVGGTVTQPGCAALGTFLGLGAVVVPGLPGTIEQQTGLSLATLPLSLQPELLAIVDNLLYIQGSGCGLLPLAAERTVCASDDDMESAVAQIRAQLNLPGLPVQLGDFVPPPAPTAGAIVDTFRFLETLGTPGAAEVVAALNDVGDCEVRSRFANVEPPPVPPDAALRPPTTPPAVPDPEPAPVAAPAFNRPPTPPAAPIASTGPVATAPVGATGLPIAASETLRGWLRWLAVLALVAFMYRSIAPRREQLT